MVSFRTKKCFLYLTDACVNAAKLLPWPSFVLQPPFYAFLALKLLLGDELTYQITKSYAKNQIKFNYITNIK